MSVLYIHGAENLHFPERIQNEVQNAQQPIVGLRLTAVDIDGEPLRLRSDQLQILVNLLERYNIEHLQCQNVDFDTCTSSPGNSIKLKNCPILKTIELIDCQQAIRFIVRAVCDCPLLESVNTRSKYEESLASLDIQCRTMAINLNKNCQLRHFSLAEMTTNQRRVSPQLAAVTRYRDFIDQVIKRNDRGRVACQKAIYQLFLIKRHSQSELFACLNLDIVKLIAKMLYASRLSRVWYPLLKLD